MSDCCKTERTNYIEVLPTVLSVTRLSTWHLHSVRVWDSCSGQDISGWLLTQLDCSVTRLRRSLYPWLLSMVLGNLGEYIKFSVTVFFVPKKYPKLIEITFFSKTANVAVWIRACNSNITPSHLSGSQKLQFQSRYASGWKCHFCEKFGGG